ncbi:hypothetical protein A0J61_09973 [Choanephora cucurbitarum]|uniref:Uncharacterized protein n=1 Tax=Choanephora cucurbitarum TaxID=101091 RepID=A0A1C7MYY8_9FUNG|nr:hypothetical protein A0J61_09973 [Choanephora cucurbitarum]
MTMENIFKKLKRGYRKLFADWVRNKMHQKESKDCLEKITLAHRATPMTQYNIRESIPLCQLKRYSLSQSTKIQFSRQRRTLPFQPLYEIEWQKNKWLQLDLDTSKQIERMRLQGHTHLAIRKDSIIRQHMEYAFKEDTDVVLELMFTGPTERQSITCQYHANPLQFAIRRAYLWRIEYDIGFAYLPSWVDQDVCCHHTLLDAHSALTSMTLSCSMGSSIESH